MNYGTHETRLIVKIARHEEKIQKIDAQIGRLMSLRVDMENELVDLIEKRNSYRK